MWKIPSQRLLDLQHLNLYPLLPLTQGGATREIITTMFDCLPGEQHRDFAAIGFAFATIRFQMLKRESDLLWLQERFCYMNDIIRESPFYQWISEEEREKDLAQMRQTIVDFVQEHFPELAQLVEEVVATIDTLPQLGRLSIKLGGAQSAQQARKILSSLEQ